MRKTSTFFLLLLSVTFFSCQPEEESFVSLDLESSQYLFLGQSYSIAIDHSSDVDRVEIKVGEQDIVEPDKNSFEFNPIVATQETVVEITGFDSKDNSVATKQYIVHIAEMPAVDIFSPVADMQLKIDDDFAFEGSFSDPVATVVISEGSKEIERFDGSPFKIDYQLSYTGEYNFTFSFRDAQGVEILSELRTITVLNADGSSDDNQDYDIPLFNRTWENEHTAIIIDAYQGNGINWDKMAADPRMVAVIHRSGDGTRIDTKYRSRRAIARDRGYLWGAYHLGRPGNVQKQADMFLELIDEDPDTLMILDLEATSSSSMMDINEATQFMEIVYEHTGKIPVVYANHSVTIELNSRVANHPLFQRAPLWYARFRKDIPNFPTGIWNKYFMWQFSSEINCSKTGHCLYNVPGTTNNMDINVYAGTPSQLRKNWVNPH